MLFLVRPARYRFSTIAWFSNPDRCYGSAPRSFLRVKSSSSASHWLMELNQAPFKCALSYGLLVLIIRRRGRLGCSIVNNRSQSQLEKGGPIWRCKFRESNSNQGWFSGPKKILWHARESSMTIRTLPRDDAIEPRNKPTGVRAEGAPGTLIRFSVISHLFIVR
jgi:hypothetical protein